MCEVCANAMPPTSQNRRRRLWEISSGSHCSVVGTCLTLADLRALSRKLHLTVREDFPVDYQLHGYFVRNACKGERAAKMLNRLLDRRHAAAIRRARTMKTGCELEAFWSEAKEAGDIPGPYWAILTHPAVTQDLSEFMFADVHMLSHLVGASNRADIRRLGRFEEQVATLEEKLTTQQRRHRQRIDSRDRTISALQTELRLATAHPRETPKPAASAPDESATQRDTSADIARLEARAARSAATIDDQQSQIDELTHALATLREENRALELALLREHPEEDNGCPFDLGGRCLLYVGGRQKMMPHLRALVEAWNGQLIHHDGGKERSIDELAGVVVKADAVVFPTDCVSHGAALKVKRLCQQSMKPFVPLRSSGVASFVAGLREGLDGAGIVAATAEINAGVNDGVNARVNG